MIIDIHTHTFPDKIAPVAVERVKNLCHEMPHTDGTISGLTASMKEAGVDLSVILPVATSPEQVVKVNNVSAALNERERGKGLHSFGCMHPDYPDWKAELGRVAELGLKGIKIHSMYQDVIADDPRYLRILERCGELDLMVVTHAGWDNAFPGVSMCTPAMFRNVFRQVGPVKFVLAHMGGWRCWEEAEDLLADTPAYLDMSHVLGNVLPADDHFENGAELALMSDEQFVHMVHSFGAHRILFGSDSPWTGQKQTLEHFRSLPLTPEEQTAILGGNAQRLLNLTRE